MEIKMQDRTAASSPTQHFRTLPSTVQQHGEEFAANVAAWTGILSKYNAALAGTYSEGSSNGVSKHRNRGQLFGK
jgi:hypothetical protein